MRERPKPRYPNVTAIIGADALGFRQQQLASGPSVGTYKMMALEAYALGHPLGSVIEFLRKSVAVQISQFHHPSYRVSWHNFESACVPLAIGDFASAAQIAERIEDPPDADYIGRRSEVCTPEQQKVAYAFRDIYLNRTPATAGDLFRISLLWKARGFQKNVAYYAGILRAVLTSDAKAVFDGFTSLLYWHAHEAGQDWRNTERESFLYIQPLGIAVFLISRGLLAVDQLPQDDIHFPIEMVRMALNPT
jgi:hypothetical protein